MDWGIFWFTIFIFFITSEHLILAGWLVFGNYRCTVDKTNTNKQKTFIGILEARLLCFGDGLAAFCWEWKNKFDVICSKWPSSDYRCMGGWEWRFSFLVFEGKGKCGKWNFFFLLDGYWWFDSGNFFFLLSNDSRL